MNDKFHNGSLPFLGYRKLFVDLAAVRKLVFVSVFVYRNGFGFFSIRYGIIFVKKFSKLKKELLYMQYNKNILIVMTVL